MFRIIREGFNKYWAISGASHSMLVLLSNVMHTCWTTFSKWYYHLTMNLRCFSSAVCLPTWWMNEWMNETECYWGCFAWHLVTKLWISRLCMVIPNLGSFCITLSCIWSQSKVYKSYSLICVWFKLKTLSLWCKKTYIICWSVWSLNQRILKILRKG